MSRLDKRHQPLHVKGGVITRSSWQFQIFIGYDAKEELHRRGEAGDDIGHHGSVDMGLMS